jgi:hypothetical protein
MASNIVPFPRRHANDNVEPGLPPFNPGVVPFDRRNPQHVGAWNAMFAMGQAERRARDAEGL